MHTNETGAAGQRTLPFEDQEIWSALPEQVRERCRSLWRQLLASALRPTWRPLSKETPGFRGPPTRHQHHTADELPGWPSPDRGRQKYSASGPETLHRDNHCGGNKGWDAPFPLSFYLDGDPSLLAPVLPTLLGQRSKLLSAERPKSSHATMHVHMKWHDHETDSGQPGYQRQNRRVPSP